MVAYTRVYDEFCSRQISQEMMAVGRGQLVKLNVTYIGAEERRSWIECARRAKVIRELVGDTAIHASKPLATDAAFCPMDLPDMLASHS